MSNDSQAVARNARQLLWSRAFGLLFAAKLVTTAASWTHSTAAAILVYDRTGSSVAVAVVTVAQYAPQFVLAPVSGTWADRYDPTRQLVIGRACCVVGALATLLWAACRWDVASPNESTIAISIGATLVGLGFVVGGPASQAIIPALVRADELTVAMALNTAPMTLARVVGPTVGALAVAGAGPVVAFAISAAGQAIFIPLVILAQLPRTHEARPRGAGAPAREVVSFLRRDRAVAAGLVGVFAVGVGSEPALTLAPALAESLGHGAVAVGVLTAFFGVGAAVTLLLISLLGARVLASRLARLGLGLLCGGLMGCAVVPWLWTCLICAAAMGAGFSAGLTGLSTIVQRGAPDMLRGRVMSVWLLAFLGSRPLSVSLAGVVADLSNVRWAFASAGLLVGLLAVVAARRGGGWRRNSVDNASHSLQLDI